MADPLSVVASTLSIADIAVRLVSYLRDVQRSAATIEDDIASLIHEIEALNTISQAINRTFKDEHRPDTINDKADESAHLWKYVGQTLHDSNSVIERLEAAVKAIYEKHGPNVVGFRDAVDKVRKKKNKEGELRQCRDQLSSYQNVLHILLAFINAHDTKESREENARAFKQLAAKLRDIDHNLGTQITTLKDTVESASIPLASKDDGHMASLLGLRRIVTWAENTIEPNKHFDIPQPVSSIFTGREKALKELENVLIDLPDDSKHSQQRRFVIYGIGGSGKTQFCSKFAQDNRNSFWGVFLVDASSTERIKQTYSAIAKIAGVEPNEHAAMHWLSNIEQRWLLIIDNADDRAFQLEKYLPRGDRGHILVTTRNPDLKVHGNVGPGFYDFHGLSFREANELLLKAAEQPIPWDNMCENHASVITETLGFLVLAIVHAGAAIRKGLCTLTEYLGFYERSWERMRGEKIDASQDDIAVYKTFEVSFQDIETRAAEGREAAQDAVQLLITFSFFHWKTIKYDILRRALENPVHEATHAGKETQNVKQTRPLPPETSTMLQSIQRINMAFLTWLLQDRSPVALPRVVRDSRKATSLKALGNYHDRLRLALQGLVQLSLITHNKANDSYSMHPVVHTWVRERPGMRLAEQAIWSEAAAMVLSSSVLLPPLHDENYNRDVLPHIDHVRECRRAIDDRISDRLRERWINWFIPRTTINPVRTLMYAKFSIVYMHCGYFSHAEELQTDVKNFLERMLGPSHEKTRRITQALAATYWHMGRGVEAEKLQRGVLNACLTTLGHEHLDTLLAKDMLASTLWQRGRYTDAEELQKDALSGLEKRYGSHHEESLNALDNLARTIAKFWEEDHLREAYKLHSKAIKGMEKLHGADHPRTLIAKENLSRVAYYRGGEYVEEAETIIASVIEDRKRKLGKEHPYTLLAMATSALIKNALGKTDEAEELLDAGLPIAKRNLGEDHIGTLFGYHTLGTIRIRQGRYAEAEEILEDVIEKQRLMSSHRGEHHPDRLGAMMELAKCYRLQGKIEESINMCNEVLDGFKAIGKPHHPLARDLRRGRERMAKHLEMVALGERGEEGIVEPGTGPYKQFDPFGS